MPRKPKCKESIERPETDILHRNCFRLDGYVYYCYGDEYFFKVKEYSTPRISKEVFEEDFKRALNKVRGSCIYYF